MGFLRLGNSAREFLGVNFSSRDFISALISAPLRSPSSYWLWSTQRPSPLPLPGWWWAIILWCGYSITFQPSTSFGWKQQESVPFFPRSHHDSAQAYFPTFRMRFQIPNMPQLHFWCVHYNVWFLVITHNICSSCFNDALIQTFSFCERGSRKDFFPSCNKLLNWVHKKCFPNYKKNDADHKKPIPHHLGRYLLNNDTFVRDGAVTVDIEQTWAEFFAVRPVADFVSL